MAAGPVQDDVLDLIDHAELERGPDPVPVLVLTGFLGAGKTTLLSRILKGDHGLRVAVLVNDFGDINIDADLVAGLRAGVVSLANGCVCCTIRDDLIETVLATVDLPERPEYIVLEASGVAEPSGIAVTLALPRLRGRIRLDSVTCVLDAEQVFEVPELIELKIWQAAFADLLVLNKVDLVDRAQVDRVRRWLDERMHRYRLVEAVRGDVRLDLLMSAGRAGLAGWTPPGAGDPGAGGAGATGATTTQSLDTWSFETGRSFRIEALRHAAGRLPAGVYRAKGIIDTVEFPDRPVVLHVVGRRVDLSVGQPWQSGPSGPPGPSGERRSRIVAIGAPGAIEGGLSTFFADCLATLPLSMGHSFDRR